MKKSIVVIATALLLLTGCQHTKRSKHSKGAETTVRVTHNEPTNCKYLGDTTASYGNAFTGGFISNNKLETRARTNLKKKAAKMGGNVVYILSSRAGTSDGEQTSVTLSGNVYKCKK